MRQTLKKCSQHRLGLDLDSVRVSMSYNPSNGGATSESYQTMHEDQRMYGHHVLDSEVS